MKITDIRIHNFRSIGDCSLQECSDMMVLLGQNNHGKSNAISAIEFALTSAAKPDAEDLFAFAGDEDRQIWVELEFAGLTEQERTTWRKYVRADGSFRFRKTATFGNDGGVSISYNGYCEEAEEEWLRTANVGEYAKRDAIAGTPLSGLVPESGRLTKAHVEEAQRRYIEENRSAITFREELETGPLLGQKTVAAGVLPNFFVVPAIRDLSEEAKVKSTALFGKLLAYAIEKMTLADPRFGVIEQQLSDLIGTLNASSDTDERPQQLVDLEQSIQQELAGWGVQVSVEVAAPDISKVFELGTDIHLDDGLKTLASRKGHGLQRAVIFGLMKAWARLIQPGTGEAGDPSARKASESVVFAIEEPELFLHPHAQRALAATLRVLAGTENTQVFICSHSTHFVDLDEYRGIALVRKPTAAGGTQFVQCGEDLFPGEADGDRKHRFHMASWVNPDRGEMLFAQRVAFVEGETEKVLFPFLARKLGCHSDDVSVIDCGSKNNLPLYIQIAEAFELDFVVVHDEDPIPDPVPENWSVDKVCGKRRTFALNQGIRDLVGSAGRIAVMCPDFERANGVSRSRGTKVGKALAALDHFSDPDPGEIREGLEAAVRLIYRQA